MPLSRRRFSGLLALIPAVMLPLPALAQMKQLDGHVTYRERMALPADTVTEIRLEDVSRADAPAQVIARQVIRDAVASPIPFRLTFDSTAIQPGHDYALRAQIRDGDDLLFTTTTHHPAFGPSQDITVQRVAQSPALPLGGDWLAEDIQGGGVIDNLQSTLHIAEDGHVSGSGGCNRFTGTARIEGATLRIGPLASTRRLCPPAVMDQEAKFLQALTAARSFQTLPAQRKLLLLDENDRPILLLAR
ncbi:META domain-containing protein [Paracoccus shanxieyensis]|uniref:META domain-containing protein n=1 Tax=Paracoccus shanxieyensis TaxID=2675752 RepID=A0A6L6IZL6_9RHOB|nr:META domain-containing protein [Paracoccus shanxieyensis]MTH64014.1 META domain-containing protein [Paracoccus shanxieyensis]MTH86945.1 META domain-containing protein [Paracoccus shanxieyensis]